MSECATCRNCGRPIQQRRNFWAHTKTVGGEQCEGAEPKGETMDPKRMSPEELAAIRARSDAALAGPWKAELDVFEHDVPEIEVVIGDVGRALFFTIGTDIVDTGGGMLRPIAPTDGPWERAAKSQAMRDGQFIAAARSDVPRLLLEVAGLERENEARKKFLEALDRDPHQWSRRPCPTCDPVSGAFAIPFGCTGYRQRLAARTAATEDGT